jgi:hypothetical protein
LLLQSGSVIQQDSEIFWDLANKKLGIGKSPAATSAKAVIAITDGTGNQNYWLTLRNTALGYGSWGFVKLDSNDLGITYQTDVDAPNLGTSLRFYYGGNSSFGGSLAVGNLTTPSARLDVRAQGALSTDTAFRVRNSADNNNLITITGNGNITVGNSSIVPSTSTLRVFSGFGGGNFLNLINDSTSFGVYQGLDMAHTGRPGYFALETAGNQGSSITRFRGGGSNSAGAKITAYIDHPGDTDKTGHWHFRTQVHLEMLIGHIYQH